jgi:hypothetical protein
MPLMGSPLEAYREDPIMQSIGYFHKNPNYFNLIFLIERKLNRAQLQTVAPTMKSIVHDCQSRKPFDQISELVRRDYGNEAAFESKRAEIDRLNFWLVDSYLINAARVVGPRKIERSFRQKSGKYSREEVCYSHALMRLVKFLSKIDTNDRLNEFDLACIETALYAVDRLLTAPSKV